MTDPVLDPTLRYEALNAHITAGYARLAHALQRRVDAGHGEGGPSMARPVWFAIAAWASREVGASLVAAGQTLGHVTALADGATPDELADALRDPLPSALRRALRVAGLPRDTAAALTVLLSLRHDDDDPADDPANLAALLDPRVLVVTASRAAALLAAAPGTSLLARAGAVIRTARNLLEDGNRRIYSDIGLPTAAFLAAAGPPEGALAALAAWSWPGGEGADEVFDHVARAVREGVTPRRFDALPGGGRSAAVIGAGLACFDEAAVDPGREGAWIAAGNNLLAWREQAVAVQPAFTPPGVLPGEVDRAALFATLTPTVRLPVGEVTWRLSDFAPHGIAPRDRSPLTARVTEVTWASFEDRWPAILDAFDAVYARPGAAWPLPAPDPRAR